MPVSDAEIDAFLRRGVADATTTPEAIANRIAIAIELGLLAPGDRLPAPAKLADHFGVAPISIRRALDALAEGGLVRRRRGRNGGTFVAERPPDRGLARHSEDETGAEADALLAQRLVLECGTAYVAAARATAADVAELRALADAMDRSEDWMEFRRHDPAFHLTLARIAGSELVHDELSHVLARLLALYVPYPIEYLRSSNRQHVEIADALEAGDGAAAVAAVARHLGDVEDTFNAAP